MQDFDAIIISFFNKKLFQKQEILLAVHNKCEGCENIPKIHGATVSITMQDRYD